MKKWTLFFPLLLSAQVATVPNTDFPTFRANLNRSLQKAVSLDGNYVNPSWITSLAWTKVSGKPTFVASATTDTTNASNISSGTLGAARLPLPGVSTLGAVKRVDCTGVGHILSINSDGGGTCTADTGTGGGAVGTANHIQTSNGSGLFADSGCTALTGTLTCAIFNSSDTSHSAAVYLTGLTSGGMALAAADVAGTPVTYTLPTVAGTTGQVLSDGGSVTCPTLASGNPTTCRALVWATPSSGGTLATPIFSPNAGTYTSTQSVTLTCPSGSTCCYTTNGSTPAATTPGTCSTGSTYSTAISVASTETVKALASQAGFINSSVGSALYTITASDAISFVQSKLCQGASVTACTLDSLPTVGNLLVVANGARCGNATLAPFLPTDNQTGNTYTSLKTTNPDGYYALQVSGLLVVGSTGTFIVSGDTYASDGSCAAANKAIFIAEYSGVTQLTLDQAVLSGMNLSPPTSWGSITTTNADDLIVAVAMTDGVYTNYSGQTWSATSGFNMRTAAGPVAHSIGYFDQIATSTGTFTGGLSCSGSGCTTGYLEGRGIVVSLKK